MSRRLQPHHAASTSSASLSIRSGAFAALHGAESHVFVDCDNPAHLGRSDPPDDQITGFVHEEGDVALALSRTAASWSDDEVRAMHGERLAALGLTNPGPAQVHRFSWPCLPTDDERTRLTHWREHNGRDGLFLFNESVCGFGMVNLFRSLHEEVPADP